MKRIVLIADIISSREIKNRDRIQRKLKAVLRRINQESRSVLSPMTITLGDEFQCVYSDSDEIFRHIWEILTVCYPEKIRFSYGIGEITTAINREQAIGMDGPAFYEAREGLNSIKQTSCLFSIRSGRNQEIVSLIKNTLCLVSYNVESWKQNRIEIMKLLADKMPVKLIARKMDISEQAVYKNITSGGLQSVLDVTTDMTFILNNLLKT